MQMENTTRMEGSDSLWTKEIEFTIIKKRVVSRKKSYLSFSLFPLLTLPSALCGVEGSLRGPVWKSLFGTPWFWKSLLGTPWGSSWGVGAAGAVSVSDSSSKLCVLRPSASVPSFCGSHLNLVPFLCHVQNSLGLYGKWSCLNFALSRVVFSS